MEAVNPRRKRERSLAETNPDWQRLVWRNAGAAKATTAAPPTSALVARVSEIFQTSGADTIVNDRRALQEVSRCA